MKRFFIIIIGTVILAFSVSYIQINLSTNPLLTRAQSLGFQTVSNCSVFFNNLGKFIISPFESIVSNINAEKNYRKTLKSLEENRISQLQLRVLRLENSQLREELRYRNQVLREFKPISAEVVARGLDSWFDTVTIDKGWKDGIEEDMPVINTRGLVGRVVETSDHLSKVMLLINQNSNVSAVVFETQDKGIVQGRGLSNLLLKYIPHGSVVIRNMKIYTSGISLVFPRGILIGNISKVVKKKYEHIQYIEVKPAVDFAKLDRVWVITEKIGYGSLNSNLVQSK